MAAAAAACCALYAHLRSTDDPAAVAPAHAFGAASRRVSAATTDLGFDSRRRLAGASSNAFPQCTADLPVQKVAFVKTHKTGGSTLANIVYRYGERHDLRFVLPVDDLRLGWPNKFPGKFSADGSASPEYDLVSHHAVFSYSRMRAFVPQARFITILREPVSQFTSAWYYFKNSRMKERVVEEVAKADGNGTRAAATNESLSLKSIQVAIQPIVDAKGAGNSKEARIRNRLINSQSFTLGYEDWIGGGDAEDEIDGGQSIDGVYRDTKVCWGLAGTPCPAGRPNPQPQTPSDRPTVPLTKTSTPSPTSFASWRRVRWRRARRGSRCWVTHLRCWR